MQPILALCTLVSSYVCVWKSSVLIKCLALQLGSATQIQMMSFSGYAVVSTSNIQSGNTTRQTHVQKEFWPESLCVLTKGSPDPESGMWWFRLCAQPVYACFCDFLACVCVFEWYTRICSGNVSVRDIMVCNERKLAALRGNRIQSAPVGNGGRCFFYKYIKNTPSKTL